MLDLNEIRGRIDVIDNQLVRLYEERMDICKDVARFKIENGKKVLDRDRERSKLETVAKITNDEAYKQGVTELFEQIMASSRKMQYRMLSEAGAIGQLAFIEIPRLNKENCRVVYQGTKGANSEAAMRAYFGDDVNAFHVPTFRDAMEAIEEGLADYAVLPIENSSAGIVNDIYDLLVEFENFIVGEQVIKIENCLLGVPGASKDDIKTVYSHPQALMQSAKYLNERTGWQQISVLNTAAAAKMVSDSNDKTKAAVANSLAAKIYGLDILEPELCANSNNSTRFIIVTNQKVYCKDADKISICFELEHTSGSLYHAMSHFIHNGLNMTKIESRPIEDKNWEYRFFIDFEGNLHDSGVKNALRGLRDETRNMRILGNY